MGNPANDNAVWAYLGPDNVAILCSRKQANDWWNSEDGNRTRIKTDKVKGWGVWTVFWRFCLIPDGPPLFWRVSWYTGSILDSTDRRGERHFGTIEAALEFHAGIMATIRKGSVPDGTSLETGHVLEPFADDEDEGETRDAADWWKE